MYLYSLGDDFIITKQIINIVDTVDAGHIPKEPKTKYVDLVKKTKDKDIAKTILYWDGDHILVLTRDLEDDPHCSRKTAWNIPEIGKNDGKWRRSMFKDVLEIANKKNIQNLKKKMGFFHLALLDWKSVELK